MTSKMPSKTTFVFDSSNPAAMEALQSATNCGTHYGLGAPISVQEQHRGFTAIYELDDGLKAIYYAPPGMRFVPQSIVDEDGVPLWDYREHFRPNCGQFPLFFFASEEEHGIPGGGIVFAVTGHKDGNLNLPTVEMAVLAIEFGYEGGQLIRVTDGRIQMHPDCEASAIETLSAKLAAAHFCNIPHEGVWMTPAERNVYRFGPQKEEAPAQEARPPQSPATLLVVGGTDTGLNSATLVLPESQGLEVGTTPATQAPPPAAYSVEMLVAGVSMPVAVFSHHGKRKPNAKAVTLANHGVRGTIAICSDKSNATAHLFMLADDGSVTALADGKAVDVPAKPSDAAPSGAADDEADATPEAQASDDNNQQASAV